MATNISVRISRNPHGFPGARFEASFVWNGLLNRYQFDDRFQLANKLVDDSTEQAVIDEVMDSLDAAEWQEQPIYPLGVCYVGEAVSDCCCGPLECDDPVYANVRAASYVDSVNAKFYRWTVAFLTITVAWLVFRRNG